jgi:enolase
MDIKATIKEIHAREILDSRGNPTVEADIMTENGLFRSSVPSGASTGKFEAREKRDGGDRLQGKGVLEAVDAVNSKIAPELIGLSVLDQKLIDEKLIELDGTPNKEKYGANAILAVSMSVAKAGAAANNLTLYAYIARLAGSRGIMLPIPQLNVINGGRHAGMDDDIQEHLILPIGAESFQHAMEIACDVYHCLRGIIKEAHGATGTNLGDEGGFVPPNGKRRQGVNGPGLCSFRILPIGNLSYWEKILFLKGAGRLL